MFEKRSKNKIVSLFLITTLTRLFSTLYEKNFIASITTFVLQMDEQMKKKILKFCIVFCMNVFRSSWKRTWKFIHKKKFIYRNFL